MRAPPITPEEARFERASAATLVPTMDFQVTAPRMGELMEAPRRAAAPPSPSADGVRIYFEEHGRGEPVLLAYGIGGNAGMWEPNIRALSASHRRILWEPRGHARSDSPEDPRQVTFGHWVGDLHDLMDHLQLERAIVGGLSLRGGRRAAFTPALS